MTTIKTQQFTPIDATVIKKEQAQLQATNINLTPKVAALIVEEKQTNANIQIQDPSTLNHYLAKPDDKITLNSPQIFESLLTKIADAAAVSDTTPASTAATTKTAYQINHSNLSLNPMALIMKILEDILPRLLDATNKLNQSFNELAINQAKLDIEGALAAYEYSIQSVQQTKLAASQTLASELTGATVELGGGAATFANTHINNRNATFKHIDKQNEFKAFAEKKSDFEAQLLKGDPELNDPMFKMKSSQEQADIYSKKLAQAEEAFSQKYLQKLTPEDRAELDSYKAKLSAQQALREQNLNEQLQPEIKGSNKDKNKAIISNLKVIEENKELIPNASNNLATLKQHLADKEPGTAIDPTKLTALNAAPSPEELNQLAQTKATVTDLGNGQKLVLVPCAADGKNLTLYKIGPNADNAINCQKVLDVEIDDEDLINNVAAGKIYDEKELEDIKNLLTANTPDSPDATALSTQIDSVLGNKQQIASSEALTLLKAKAEYDANAGTINLVQKYFDANHDSIEILGKKLDFRHNMHNGSIQTLTGSARLATSSINYDARYDEANARQVEAFGHVIEQIFNTLNKGEHNLLDDMEKTKKALYENVYQLLQTCVNLMTRLYSTSAR